MSPINYTEKIIQNQKRVQSGNIQEVILLLIFIPTTWSDQHNLSEANQLNSHLIWKLHWDRKSNNERHLRQDYIKRCSDKLAENNAYYNNEWTKPEVCVEDCKLLRGSRDVESKPAYSSLQQPLHVNWNGVT